MCLSNGSKSLRLQCFAYRERLYIEITMLHIYNTRDTKKQDFMLNSHAYTMHTDDNSCDTKKQDS